MVALCTLCINIIVKRWPNEKLIKSQMSDAVQNKCCEHHLKWSNKKCKQCISNEKNPCGRYMVMVQISNHHPLFINEKLKKEMVISNMTQSKYDDLKYDKIEDKSSIMDHTYNHYSYQNADSNVDNQCMDIYQNRSYGLRAPLSSKICDESYLNQTIDRYVPKDKNEEGDYKLIGSDESSELEINEEYYKSSSTQPNWYVNYVYDL